MNKCVSVVRKERKWVTAEWRLCKDRLRTLRKCSQSVEVEESGKCWMQILWIPKKWLPNNSVHGCVIIAEGRIELRKRYLIISNHDRVRVYECNFESRTENIFCPSLFRSESIRYDISAIAKHRFYCPNLNTENMIYWNRNPRIFLCLIPKKMGTQSGANQETTTESEMNTRSAQNVVQIEFPLPRCLYQLDNRDMRKYLAKLMAWILEYVLWG